MSLKLSQFFLARGYLNNIKVAQLSNHDFPIIIESLWDDVDSFFVNGLTSLSASINSLNNANYSWAFIQSYYSIFFLARAFNGVNRNAIIYSRTTPYSIKIYPHEQFRKQKGNSHNVVLSQFKKHLSNDTLLQNNIEGKSPVEWFNQKRNYINYKLNPFTDPIPPKNIFAFKTDLRKWISRYLNDTTHFYTFTPEHCYISYPIQLFNRLFDYYIENNRTNIYIDEEKIKFFKMNISDSNGPITPFIARINDIAAK